MRYAFLTLLAASNLGSAIGTTMRLIQTDSTADYFATCICISVNVAGFMACLMMRETKYAKGPA